MSTQQEDLRITMLMDTLRISKAVPDNKKRDLSGDLQYARSINGNPDPAQQTSKRMLLAGVSREIESYERHEDLKRELSVIVNGALDNHAKNCVFVLMKARAEEEAKRKQLAAVSGEVPAEVEDDESSIKIGKIVEARGGAATVVAVVAAFAVVVIGWVGWQNSKTRDVIKQSMNAAVQEALLDK